MGFQGRDSHVGGRPEPMNKACPCGPVGCLCSIGAFVVGFLTGRNLFPKETETTGQAPTDQSADLDASDLCLLDSLATTQPAARLSTSDLGIEILKRWRTANEQSSHTEVPLTEVSFPLPGPRQHFSVGDKVTVKGKSSPDQITAVRQGNFGTKTFYQTQSDKLWRVASNLESHYAQPLNAPSGAK